MCGIVGYIGTQKAKPILINGLLRLEYRGYDSSGVATIEGNKIKMVKNKGRVRDLQNTEGIDNLEGTVGIGHTRWATHGKPSAVNSHPHMDNSNTFAVVHNGIIENYAELKSSLEKKGYKFLSETDTEVVPNLIHYYYSKGKKDKMGFLSAVSETCKNLKGSFALEIISSEFPDNMIVVRKDSPLVIGTCPDENYISSDIPAILSFTKDFYLLNDMEFAYLSRDSVSFYDSNLNEVQKAPVNIDWSAASAEKDGYDDFMLKEIYEQPKSIRETIGSRINENGKTAIDGLEGITKEYLTSLNKIYIVACGTAMHAGLAAKTMLEQICEIQTEVDIASEFRYRNPLIDEKTLCIYISQSGETADTIAALKLAKEKGSKTIAISNVIGSSITREADYTVYTHAGPEIAVASTKAYTSQIVLLGIVSIYFAEILERNLDKTAKLKKEILELPKKVEKALKLAPEVKEFANKVYKEKDIFFLGRGVDYSSSLEASLKLKEISYIHSDAYASGELKHGAIALIENGITVVSIITVPALIEKSISNVQEVITRGAKTLIVTNQKLDKTKFDKVVEIPECSEYLSSVVAIIPMQLFAYYISKEKGLDVDKPRNLAKSVTVE